MLWRLRLRQQPRFVLFRGCRQVLIIVKKFSERFVQLATDTFMLYAILQQLGLDSSVSENVPMLPQYTQNGSMKLRTWFVLHFQHVFHLLNTFLPVFEFLKAYHSVVSKPFILGPRTHETGLRNILFTMKLS
ncbi:hypothetical protein NPIL_117421 [Nephila pilipes]|uniref:Uncharacterized protein n=1 Tax=Nephila pilipes TaxID=299642 RepID=A0A8X6QV39_NEPPI|nr:hypothetical protein NPIL_117421 [Nephila pilipes]